MIQKSEIVDHAWAKREEAFEMLCWPEKKTLEKLSYGIINLL